MSGHHVPCGNYPEIVCKFMVGFISLTYNLIIHQIDITSRHFAVAFEIPIHNISIYFDKLFSVRCLLLFVSELFENCIFQVAGGDRNPERSMKVRKYVGTSAFGALLAVRIVYLFFLYRSHKLSFHIYTVLSIEAFPYGFHDSSFIALVSEYMSIASMLFNLGRLFVFSVQFVLDMLWFSRPLLMIKIQAWICVIFTFIAVGLWYYYLFKIKVKQAPSPQEIVEIAKGPAEKAEVVDTRTPGQIYCDNRFGNDGVGAALSPIMMYWFSSFYRDFLYPGTLPYGLLARDKCHMINMLMPVFNLLGPLTFFFLDNFTDKFGCWRPYLDLIWLLYIPLPIIFVYTLLAIHTKIPSARAIINSRPRIMTMTLVMIISFGFMEPLSWMGIGKYASRGNPHGFTILGVQMNLSFIGRSLFSRLSVGYGDVRVKLGYHLPKFRPTHKMSDFNTFWYILKNTFKRSLQDVKGDFKMDIKKYL